LEGETHLPNFVLFSIALLILVSGCPGSRFGSALLFLVIGNIVHRNIILLLYVTAFQTLLLAFGRGSLDLILTSQLFGKVFMEEELQDRGTGQASY
jgi:hypothetical protein